MAFSMQQISVYIGFCLSVLINSLLMYLIRKKTTKQLGSYVYLMISFSVFELVFSTVDLLNQPMILVDDGEFLFFSRNPLHLNVLLAKHFNLINFACSGIIISLLAIHFFYRYMAVCNNQNWLRQFEMPRFYIWIAIFVVFGLEWYLATFFLGNGDDDSVCEVEMDKLVENFGADPKFAVFIGIKYHAVTPYQTIFCSKSIVLAVILLKIVLISGAIVTYCGVCTWQEISRKARAISRRTLDMQRQFFRALVVQTLIPVFLLYLPLCTMLIAPISMVSLQKVDVIIQIAFVFYPILDPIAVLIIVRDYRKTIRNFVNDHFWKRFLEMLNFSLSWRQTSRAITSPPVLNVPSPSIPRFIY